jgi:hypothetical protein
MQQKRRKEMAAKQKQQQPQPITASEQPAPRIPCAELPEWLQGTWGETAYQLIQFGDDGGGVEEICISRKEYLALKVRLAELRGISLTQEQIDTLGDAVYENLQREARVAA